jgi:hypothetical protein
MLPIAVILQHPNDEQSRGLLCVLEVFFLTSFEKYN